MTLTGLNLPICLQGIGLALLGDSTYFSLGRIKGSVQVYRMSLADATNTDHYRRLIEQERLNHAMGEASDMAQISRYEDGLKAGKVKAREYATRANGHYTWRNRLPLASLVVYAIGRDWAQIVAAPVLPTVRLSPAVAAVSGGVNWTLRTSFMTKQ